jgi:hemolysin activation/secretion protein
LSLDLYKTTYIDIDQAGTKVLTQPYVFYDNAVVYDGLNNYASKGFKAFGYGIKMPFFAAYKGFSFDLYRALAISSSAKPSSDRFGFSLNYLY